MAAKAAAGVASDVKAAGTYNVVVLKAKADGLPTTDNFELKKLPALTAADVQDGQVLVQVLYLSVDPYMRGRIGSDPKKSSSKPLDLGAVIVGATVGQVVASKSPAVRVGDVVHAYSGWREYYILPATDVEVCDTSYTHVLAKYAGGVLGMTGLTARYGIDFVGKAAPGQTVVVSGAAGAVGSIAGQLAKLKGCRVVGLAGSTAKCNYLLNVCGFDAVINYKTAIEQKKLVSELQAAAPKGVDVYFDNTGGEISDAVIPLINQKARIIVCGQIATYNSPNDAPAFGPRVLHHLLWKCATMKGFLVQEFEKYDAETYALLGALVRDGKLHSEEDIMAGGLQAAPAAFCKLFTGANNGKQVVRVSDAALALETNIKIDNAAAAAAATVNAAKQAKAKGK